MWALQRNRYHGKRQYLFIESICNDPDILAQNYRYKMMYSPDYKTTTEEEVGYCASCPKKAARHLQHEATSTVWRCPPLPPGRQLCGSSGQG